MKVLRLTKHLKVSIEHMNIETLHQTLTEKRIALTLSEQGKLKCDAPKGAVTPDIIEAIKEHRTLLLAALAEKSTEQHQTPSIRAARIEDSTHTEQPPARRAKRANIFRPSQEELALWNGYYGACSWYHNIWRDSPFGMALEYVTNEHYGSCVAISSNRLIWFYERCEHRELYTEQGIQSIEPRQLTEMLQAAYQERNIIALAALVSNFHNQCGVDETIAQAHKLFSTSDAGHKQHRAAPDTKQQTTAPSTTGKGKGRSIVYVDVHAGRAITDAGADIAFTPDCALSELLQAIQSVTACDRLYICGQLPSTYETWLIDAGMWTDYTTGKRGHYFDKEKDENHVARYQHRVSGAELEIRTMHSWYGNVEYSVEQARAGMHLLNQYLQGTFTPDAKAYATPALTFQSLWTTMNRMSGKKFDVLPDDIRALIHGSSGQGRIELCTPDEIEKISGLFYYDGVFMYSALAWGMPTEIETHDNENIYAGKVPARYRIRYTIPQNWQHIGLFMTPKDAVTGNPRDNAAWLYPGEKYQGQTFKTWTDGAELDVAYNLPDGMPAWDITILERIVYKTEKESSNKKPLDAITEKLAKMRDKVDSDMHQDAARLAIYKLVRGAIRNILLHGYGSFNRTNRDVTYILRSDEPAPDGYTGRRDIDDNTVWYSVPQKTEAYTQQFEHPEWAALIWARCRARMTKAALTLPRETIIALRTDAIAVTTEQPQWNTNEKRGTLRRKWNITKTLKAPHDFAALDALIHKHVKGDR